MKIQKRNRRSCSIGYPKRGIYFSEINTAKCFVLMNAFKHCREHKETDYRWSHIAAVFNRTGGSFPPPMLLLSRKGKMAEIRITSLSPGILRGKRNSWSVSNETCPHSKKTEEKYRVDFMCTKETKSNKMSWF